MIRLILNILWAICGGFVTAIEYLLAGLACCVTIVGIPFGVQCFKIAGLALFPFGKDFTTAGRTVLSFPFNILWLLCAGIWIFLSHVALALSLAVTVVGLPFAWQHLKLAMLALMPFGVTVREAA